VEIIWHDLGQFLCCYGQEWINSPNLDRLASEGIVMESMFCTAPQCSPSRASIMTGCYPHSNGMMGLAHLGWGYWEGQRTITQILREYGYATYLAGYQHEAGHGPSEYVARCLGYDRVLPEDIGPFIEKDLSRRQPFFLSVGSSSVHRPNRGSVSEDGAAGVELPPYVPDTPGTRMDLAQFATMIEAADARVGAVLDSLEQSGLRDNTIVLFTTDHGPELNRAKMTLYDPGLKVACLFRWPKQLQSNLRLSGMRSNIDILPTLLELAGITTPEFVQGESFASDLIGGEDAGRDYIIAEKTYHSIYDPMRCLRTSKYKYIWNLRPYLPMQVSVQHSVRMGLDAASKLYGAPRTEEELYDLEHDPDERHNLAYDDTYRDVLEELKKRLITVLRETRDPLLAGEVPARSKVFPKSEWVNVAGKFELRLTDACPDILKS